MSSISQIELDGVNVLAGLTNVFKSVSSSISSSAKVVGSTVASGAPTNVVSGVFASVGDAESAVSEIEKLVSDIEAKKWSDAPEDVLTILKTFMAILSKFGIDVPFLSQLIAIVPDLPAVSKAA